MAPPTSVSAPAVRHHFIILPRQYLTSVVEFAQGKVDPHEAGKEGGKTSGSGGDSTSGSGSGSGGSAKGGEFHCEDFELDMC
jgi:hypothetical protein